MNDACRQLVVILGDQLSHSLSSLAAADPEHDRVIMAEVAEEASYVPHHPKKIAFLFSAMRHFAAELRRAGWRVDYHDFDAAPGHTLTEVVQHAVRQCRPERIVVTRCGEWRLQQQIDDWSALLSLPVKVLEDDRFLCSLAAFRDWADGKRQLRMEYFYREMRRKTGLLMTPSGEPEGGQWNLDRDNRRKWHGDPAPSRPMQFRPDTQTRQVLELVDSHFGDNFGELQPFSFAVTRAQARQVLVHFIRHSLPWFGDYQDAMSTGEDFLFHSMLSPYLNAGLLDAMEMCRAAEDAWRRGDAPLNAVEGFIRQIIGWREYVRGIYWLRMPEYAGENRLGSHRPLPWFYWSGETEMHCVAEALRSTRQHAWAHHIQRLMITGNLALLLDVEVKAICDWYLAVYADAYEWVELPNTLGMVMHADGGFLGSKPYAASGSYVNRMSDYCRSCRYNVKTATEDDSCPLNSLYWHFVQRHKKNFSGNPRMKMIYRSWEKMAPEKRKALMEKAERILGDPESL